LPGREIDKYLFGHDEPWTGEKIYRLADAAEKFSAGRGADVDVDPLDESIDRPIPLTSNDADVAGIYLRYRLYTYQPDEMITMMALAGMRPGKLDFDPRLYQYGGLFIYPVGILLKLCDIVDLIDADPDSYVGTGIVPAVSDVSLGSPDRIMRDLAKRGVRAFRIRGRGAQAPWGQPEHWLDQEGYERMFAAGAEDGAPVRGVAVGDLRRGIALELLPPDSALTEGSLVTTSGLGGNYPRALLIGSVKSVDERPQAPFKKASVEPMAPLSSLEMVLVLTSFRPARLAGP
jgi:hypothetical protein